MAGRYIGWKDAIAKYRKKLGLSQEKFGETIDTPFSTVSAWENGNRKVSLKAQKSIIKAHPEMLEYVRIGVSESIFEEENSFQYAKDMQTYIKITQVDDGSFYCVLSGGTREDMLKIASLVENGLDIIEKN